MYSEIVNQSKTRDDLRRREQSIRSAGVEAMEAKSRADIVLGRGYSKLHSSA